MSGAIEGGDAGYDTVIFSGSYAVGSSISTAHDAGVITLDGSDLVYSGMEPVEIGPVDMFTFNGTASGDTITVQSTALVGYQFEIAGVGETIRFKDVGNLFIDGQASFDSVRFHNTVDFAGANIAVSSETITIDNTAVLTGIGDFTLSALDNASLTGSLPVTLPDAVASIQDWGD